MYRYDIITLSPLPERFNPNRILHLRYSYMSFSRVFSTSSLQKTFRIQEASSNASIEYHTESHLSMSGGH